MLCPHCQEYDISNEIEIDPIYTEAEHTRIKELEEELDDMYTQLGKESIVKYIYEIQDITDDEIYMPLATFLTLERAIFEIDSIIEKNEQISEDAEDYEEITIVKKGIGWTNGGKRVFYITREYAYSKKFDSEHWKVIKREVV